MSIIEPAHITTTKKKRSEEELVKRRAKRKEYLRQWRKDNLSKRQEYEKLYRKANLERLAKRYLEYKNKSPKNKMIAMIRTRMWGFLKRLRQNKDKGFSEYVGCTAEYLIIHIESQFKSGMTWDNHGEWHVDHIVPLSYAESIEDVYKLSNYKNLQPLWAADNIAKKAKLPYNICELVANLGLTNTRGSKK